MFSSRKDVRDKEQKIREETRRSLQRRFDESFAACEAEFRQKLLDAGHQPEQVEKILRRIAEQTRAQIAKEYQQELTRIVQARVAQECEHDVVSDRDEGLRP